jgi:predicted Fe-Mo cluster-binding NifX family protein
MPAKANPFEWICIFVYQFLIMKKVAMPILGGDLCDRFEEFEYFLISDFENPICIREEMKFPPAPEMDKIPSWLHDKGVTDIIARGIGHELVKRLNQNKIHVFVGVRKKNPEDLIFDYLQKTLETNEKMCY